MSWRLAYASLPQHAVGFFADRDLGRLHSITDKFSEEPDCSRGSLLAWGVPYPIEIEIIEFLFNDLQFFLFWGFFSLGWGLRRLFNLDFLRLFRDFFGLSLKFWSDWLDLRRLF
jgi:hypothetical protein